MTIGREDKGKRLVVRYVVAGRGPSGGPAMSDVLGRLVEVDEPVGVGGGPGLRLGNRVPRELREPGRDGFFHSWF